MTAETIEEPVINEHLETEYESTKNTNYYFLLACLGGFTLSALLAGIYVALTSFSLAAIAVAAPVAPIFAPIGTLFLFIGAACLLPFLFGGSSGRDSGYEYRSSTYSRPWSFFGSSQYDNYNGCNSTSNHNVHHHGYNSWENYQGTHQGAHRGTNQSTHHHF